jgi:glutathione S-transferase
MALVLHHLNQSRSQRVLFLLEELGVPYEIRFYKRDPRTGLAPKSLREVHPLGKSPVLTDGDTVVAETGLIIDYLIDHYGDGRLRPPADTPERLDYAYYLHYAEGSLMPLLLIGLVVGMAARKAPWPLRPVGHLFDRGVHKAFLDSQLALHLGVLDRALANRAWFAGNELTGADAIMSFPLQAARKRYGLECYPALRDWLARFEARPAWARATEKGGALTFDF